MRVTVLKNDGAVVVDGVLRSVDLGIMPEGVRIIQWDENIGHVEYYDINTPNSSIDNPAEIQPYIDLWTAAAPPAPPDPTSEELIAAAYARINAAYETEVAALTAGYPASEVASWEQQETEARAWLADNNAYTPWLKGASVECGINIPNLAATIIRNADAFSPLYGAATGKKKRLRSEIDALGPTPAPEDLDAIVW